jgi:hypothetical protein
MSKMPTFFLFDARWRTKSFMTARQQHTRSSEGPWRRRTAAAGKTCEARTQYLPYIARETHVASAGTLASSSDVWAFHWTCILQMAW